MDGLFQSDQQRKAIEDYLLSQGWNPPSIKQDQKSVSVMPPVVVDAEAPKEYPEQLYSKKAKDILDRRNYIYSRINTLGAASSELRDDLEKSAKYILEGSLKPLPDFGETPEGKSIAQFAATYRNTVEPMMTLRGELSDVSKMEDPKEKARRLRGIVPKLIQSVATNSSDALQMNEFLLGAPEMSSYFEWAKANGGHSMGNLIAYLNNPASAEIFDSDPDSYLKKAKAIWNNASKSKNFVINGLEEASSPDFLKRFGIKKIQSLDDADDYQSYIASKAAPQGKPAPQMITPQQPAATAPVRYIRDQSGRLVPERSK
jgi:hypothetical protein